MSQDDINISHCKAAWNAFWANIGRDWYFLWDSKLKFYGVFED